MTSRRVLAVEIRQSPISPPAILAVMPPSDPGDVFRGKVFAHRHLIAQSVGLPTALATFESLASQLVGFGWEVPGAEELLRVAKGDVE